jgi:hypothetical protein
MKKFISNAWYIVVVLLTTFSLILHICVGIFLGVIAGYWAWMNIMDSIGAKNDKSVS